MPQTTIPSYSLVLMQPANSTSQSIQRIRCAAHIINLVVKAIIYGKGFSKFETELAAVAPRKRSEMFCKKGIGRKIHNLSLLSLALTRDESHLPLWQSITNVQHLDDLLRDMIQQMAGEPADSNPKTAISFELVKLTTTGRRSLLIIRRHITLLPRTYTLNCALRGSRPHHDSPLRQRDGTARRPSHCSRATSRCDRMMPVSVVWRTENQYMTKYSLRRRRRRGRGP